MKVAKACTQCRAGKRKCSPNGTHDGPCRQCVKRKLTCSNNDHDREARGQRSIAPCCSTAQFDRCQHGGFDLPDHIALELVDHYIEKIHDRPHSLFHVPTLRANVRRRSIGRALLLALCSMGCRFSADAQVRSLESLLTSECKRIAQADLENICLENIQACILIANICAADANPRSETLFFRIAISMAQIMRLDCYDPADNVLDREVKRRIWWTLFMGDRWCSTGLGLPYQLNHPVRHTDLPMDENTFYGLATDQVALNTPWKPGLWAYKITLVQIFGPIQELNRQIVSSQGLNDDEIEWHTRDLAQQLDEWERTIPADIIFNDSNLQKHQQRGTGGPFIALHLGFHHYSTLLYFQYLDTRRLSTDTTKLYTSRCKYHAASYSAILKLAREKDGCEAVYPTVGHMAIVSSSVLVHTLLLGDEDEIPRARDSLKSNFEALLELEKLWPALSLMINRLVKFQNTCLLSAHRPTHRLDNWMVRYLIEHSLPLEEKSSGLNTPVSQLDLQILSSETEKLTAQGRVMDFAHWTGYEPYICL